ncbi:hypothetical protein [Kribbella swartbergensis]
MLITVGVVIGLVVLPIEVWVLVMLFAVVVGLTAVVGRATTSDAAASALARTLRRALVVCLAVVAVLGIGAVLGGGVVPLLLLVGASSPRAVEWWSRPLRRQRTRAEPVVPTPPSPGLVSTSRLCREWHESYVALSQATTPTARLRIVMARQRCLDELERRDPEGIRAWLASAASAGGDPSRFLTGRRSDHPPDQHLT